MHPWHDLDPDKETQRHSTRYEGLRSELMVCRYVSFLGYVVFFKRVSFNIGELSANLEGERNLKHP